MIRPDRVNPTDALPNYDTKKKIKTAVVRATVVLLLGYVISFISVFNVFSSPVRNNDGWIGPAIRGNKQTRDIGKVFYYESQDYLLYDIYWPLCKVWLLIQGL